MTEPLRTAKDSSSVDLKNAGPLPPASDEEDGRVLRDPEILSEPPEIDTTRAELPPRRRLRKGFVVCAILYCVGNVLSLLGVFGLIVNYEHTCDLNEVNSLFTQLNISSPDQVVSFSTRAYDTIRTTLASCAQHS